MPTTPLLPTHESLGARFTEFAGWKLPLSYEGVVAEHLAVRNSVGVFDVSHLGRFLVEGEGATRLLKKLLCNDIAKIAPGRAQYTMALNDAGGVEDDVIVWRFDDELYWVLPNGTNFDPIVTRFRSAAGPVAIEPLRDGTALVALQGPESPHVLEQVLGPMPARFRTLVTDYGGRSAYLAGTGYTGETGAEIAVPVELGENLFAELVAAGATPCGLGARDTLRLEMGYPLWGQDLDGETSPLEAGLEWVVDWDHDFIGRDALAAHKEAGIAKRLVAFTTGDRRIPRHGHALRSESAAGSVTSGGFSPVLQRGIGLGYLAPPPRRDAELEVEIRGSWVSCEQVTPPFIDS